MGEVWIATKPYRVSSTAFPERVGAVRVDVTSGSGKLLGEKKVPATQLSPLLMGPVKDCDGIEAARFENLWQYRKVYPQLGHWDHEASRPGDAWVVWRNRGYGLTTKDGKGIRRPPEVRNIRKNHGISTAPQCHWWNDRELAYIDARKQIYVPMYAELAVKTEAFAELKAMVDAGQNVMILDIDGPPLSAYPNGVRVDNNSIKDALHDTSHPFGHGYVVAALLAGVDLDAVCGNEPAQKKQRTE